MSEIIISIPAAQGDKKRFLTFPWELYKNDPYWIPPLRAEEKGLLGFGKNPFYERNKVQTFMATRDGKMVGRIAAILNVGHLERYNDGVGFFGFFESVDDQEVANALFNAASQWLKDQGCVAVRGPMNPSMNHTVGLLIDGFDSSPFFMMTYNPPYYEKLIENAGFVKSQDLYSFWGKVDMLPKVRERFLHTAEMIQERFNVKLRPLNKKRFTDDYEMFLNIYNRSLTNTWGFVPMSESEIKTMAASLKLLMIPELAIVAEIDDQPIGATFCLPDYNPRIKAINGRLFPFGFVKLLRKREEAIRRIRVISTNVIPEYQMSGLGLVLLNALVPKALECGVQECEFSWVLESNQFSRGSLEKGGAVCNKTYRVYDKPIA
ncbi:MAG: GNAT family N-acetyltransferase [Thermoguttaceae bacterium]|nr:GNAT family N-acetyltransferase [Thermoguttaceae bacterium]MBR5759456.1 GNAT family N-acetyltransferase [Thermoguttaceae bacterium]